MGNVMAQMEEAVLRHSAVEVEILKEVKKYNRRWTEGQKYQFREIGNEKYDNTETVEERKEEWRDGQKEGRKEGGETEMGKRLIVAETIMENHSGLKENSSRK